MMVKKMGAWMLLVLLTLVGDWCGCCYGCLEEERIGLLEIKALIDPNHLFLGDWVDSSNCCEWPRIKCDNTTRRVIQLSLFGARDKSSGDWVLNASLFLPFKELQSLDLSSNGVVGCFENQGFQVLASGLRNLEELHLYSNKLNDSILSSLSGFSTLKSLHLSNNRFTGSTGLNGLRNLEILYLNSNDFKESVLIESLGALPSLKTLHASFSKFKHFGKGLCNSSSLEEVFLDDSSNIPASFLRNIGHLSTLKVLSLTGVDFNSTLPAEGTFFNSSTLEELHLDRTSLPLNFLQNIGTLPTLKVLSVGQCDLNDSLPAQGWCELKNLEQLDLSGNNFGGSLPDCLGNLSSLQLLDVSNNQFTGNIASGSLTNLISIESLSLSNNLFEVPISMKPFMNHSSLKFFYSKNNKLVTEPMSFHDFIPKFQLVFFRLSNSPTSKAVNIEIPNFLYSQYDLRVLDLSHNNITGMFPSWLLKNNTQLEQLLLNENFFVGTLQLQDHPNSHMTELDISNNNMHGQILKNSCLIFPNLWILRMAENGFTGCIPSCLGNNLSMAILDLSNNQLSTVKLEQPRIWSLQLSNNNLGGQIPISIFNSSGTLFLYLSGNNFWGQIPDFPSPSWEIWVELDLSNNQFSGMLPRCFVNSTQMFTFDLSKNQFNGPIPEDFCKLDQLEYLDLSENNLSGFIPSCFSPPQITQVHLSKNRLSGPLTNGFYNSSSLITIDLRDNNFTGSIPNWIGNLSSLSVLLMRANHFDGEFPAHLCWLEKLKFLDVSQNHLSGPLPSCLGNLTFKESSALVDRMQFLRNPFWHYYTDEVIEFKTKNMYYSYQGEILDLMSGIDLSSNNFLGAIPQELGSLSEIHALNLSHNNLAGSIPATFSNLKQIESLDVSHNNLNGRIPAQLIELTFLEVFNVSYNNLSGKTPEMKYQFATFDESSYKGNPLLCGPPLQNSCDKTESPSARVPNDSNGDDGLIDMDSFYASFGVCYIIVVLTIAAVLCINPHWRRRWFYFIEECIDTCYCFLAINFRKLSRFRR